VSPVLELEVAATVPFALLLTRHLLTHLPTLRAVAVTFTLKLLGLLLRRTR
jgi:hypothetical protein